MRGGTVFEALVGNLYLAAVDAGAASRVPARFAALLGRAQDKAGARDLRDLVRMLARPG